MVMKMTVHQGEILKIDKVKKPVLVVSKNFFNESGRIIACPIYAKGNPGALHILVETEAVTGSVQCEKMALLDLEERDAQVIGQIEQNDLINITDAIQAIFDYV